MDDWKWEFLGFQSFQEGRPVQAWFNNRTVDEKGEIVDILVYLQNTTSSLWKWPEFDPLLGAGGISEIRVPNIRSSKGIITYRIYGYFGPGSRQYTFLHGTDKKVKNDTHGKGIAKQRLEQLKRGEANVHKFDF